MIQIGKRYQIQYPENSCYADSNGQIVIIKGLIKRGDLYRMWTPFGQGGSWYDTYVGDTPRAGCNFEGILVERFQRFQKHGTKFTLGTTIPCDAVIDQCYLVPVKTICSCTPQLLFAQGCQCGGI